MKSIAFYLPQFHTTPDNDRWWSEGFTDWTNVKNAKRLFRGHKQPKIPTELGYYNLLSPSTREAQAKLAREAGVYGFCYWTYWFGNGREELETPLNEIVRLGEPDFPFMIGWANESWYRKQWANGKVKSRELLIQQTYPGEYDTKAQFYRYLSAFKDKRYIRIDGRPAFLIYKPQDLPVNFISLWNSLAEKEGLDKFYFIAHIISEKEQKMSEEVCYRYYINKGFDAVNFVRLSKPFEQKTLGGFFHKLFYRFFRQPIVYNYSRAIDFFSSEIDRNENVFPTLIPNWDHTPRSGRGGWVLKNCTPDLFEKHIRNTLDKIGQKEESSKIVFLKSWNEWGEGNYMEPDSEWGNSYLETLKRNLQ